MAFDPCNFADVRAARARNGFVADSFLWPGIEGWLRCMIFLIFYFLVAIYYIMVYFTINGNQGGAKCRQP